MQHQEIQYKIWYLSVNIMLIHLTMKLIQMGGIMNNE